MVGGVVGGLVGGVVGCLVGGGSGFDVDGGGGDGSVLHIGMLLDVVLDEEPAILISDVYCGVEPMVQMQHGSPSSNPFVCPSLSVSSWHRDSVH